MSDILQRICAERRADVAAAQARLPLTQLQRKVETAPAVARSLVAAIEARLTAQSFAVIAEIKRASPSKGIINADVDVAAQAAVYSEAGAVGISVLTEPRHFCGSDDDLVTARQVVANTPILRKDFTVDVYQIWEARALGADVILLLVNVLGPDVAAYLDVARAAGMEALVEIHDEAELQIALDAGAQLVGINARNLKTFETRLEWAEALLASVPPGVIAVAESGLSTRADIERMANAGAHAFLIGEALMRQADPAASLAAWVAGS